MSRSATGCTAWSLPASWPTMLVGHLPGKPVRPLPLLQEREKEVTCRMRCCGSALGMRPSHEHSAAGVGKIVVVADMEAYSDSAVPSMATRVECLRLAQASLADSSEPGAVLPSLGRLVFF